MRTGPLHPSSSRFFPFIAPFSLPLSQQPSASGNVVTEDLVFMFEAMGVATGIDLTRLQAARVPLQQGLPGEPLYGMTPDAGLPKGFIQGATHV